MGKPALHLIEKLFHEALAHPPEERKGFLEAACGDDPELRKAVEDLLCHAGPDDPDGPTLVSPVALHAAQLRSEAPTLEIPGYEMLAELGRGGMGIVYKARQISLNRIVALKMLLPFGPGETEMLLRFRTEVEALARLHHPHIITIYDIGEHEGRPYFTMEYVPGPNLASHLQGRPQEPLDAAHLIEILARTMHVVHQQGIIHRDLKPANIILQKSEGRDQKPEGSGNDRHSDLCPLTSDICPKITDFGLAKDQAAAGRLTVTGATLGTPCYMAPEQARSKGAGIGPAADIYALGSILYEMLTGRPPFEGSSAIDVITQIINDEPVSPASIRPRLSADLVTICLKCLEKTPAKRYASALDLAEDLRRFQADEPIRARPVGVVGRMARWCRRRPLIASLIALSSLSIVSLIVTTVLLYNARLARITEEQRCQIVQLDIDIGLIYIEQGDGFMAALRFTEALRLDQGHPEKEHRERIAMALQRCPRLIQFRVAKGPVLSVHLGAKGGWLATVGSDQSIEVADAMTGRAVGPTIRLDHAPKSGVISPDGRRLLTLAPDGEARIWDLSTGKSRTLLRPGEQEVRRAVFHPDGKVLFTHGADSTVRLWDLNAEQLKPPPQEGGTVLKTVLPAVTNAALSDDGRWLFHMDADNLGQVRDLATAKPVAQPVRVKQDTQLAAISSDGTRIALVGSDKVLRVWDAGMGGWSGNPVRLGSAAKHLAFSPKAESLLTVFSDQEAQVWDIATGAAVRLAGSRDLVTDSPRFDPTGRRLIAIDSAGAAHVWATETGKRLTPPLKHSGPVHADAFWHNGTQIITIGQRGAVSVWTLPEAGKEPPVPETRPLADLITYTQLLEGARIDERQHLQFLELEELRAAWESMK